MVMIPLLFKFGVLSAMVTALLFLMLKVIFLLKALLVLNLGSIIAKLIAFKLPYHSQPQWSYYQGLSSPTGPSESWSRTPEHLEAPNKEIHVHIHNSGPSSNNVDNSWANEPYQAYSSYSSSQITPIPISKPHYSNYVSNRI